MSQGAAAQPGPVTPPEGWAPENLRKPGFAPATVVDVGAGPGTPNLYAAYPDAFHVMVEPLQEFAERLDERLTRRRGERLAVAAGDRAGTVTLHVNTSRPAMSSVYEVEGLPPSAGPWEDREVPITTLDDLLAERGWEPPFGLKIDTEGNEDRVIRGATRFLADTQFVIAEVWAAERFRGSYGFAGFVRLMDERGFRLCDVIHVQRSPRTGEALYLDAIFRR
jgi:FkbM family methyltransferase